MKHSPGFATANAGGFGPRTERLSMSYTITTVAPKTHEWISDESSETRRGARVLAKSMRARHTTEHGAQVQISTDDGDALESWTNDAGVWRRDATRTSLTTAQKRALVEIASTTTGYRKWWPKGLARAAWERCAERLCAAGLARHYLHGGYEVTDAGRSLLASWAASSPSTAAANARGIRGLSAGGPNR